MFRNVAAAIAGLVTAFVLILLIERTGHMLYPPPEDLDFSDPDAMRPYIATLPFIALLFPMFAWVIGVFAGTVVACKIGTLNPLIFASIVAGLVLAGTIANLIMIPHPLWFSIVSLIAIAASAWFAVRVASGRNVELPGDEDD